MFTVGCIPYAVAPCCCFVVFIVRLRPSPYSLAVLVSYTATVLRQRNSFVLNVVGNVLTMSYVVST